MDDKEPQSPKNSVFTSIIIAQAVCVAIILLSVLCVKYFRKDEYTGLKAWYSTEIATDTDIREVTE